MKTGSAPFPAPGPSPSPGRPRASQGSSGQLGVVIKQSSLNFSKSRAEVSERDPESKAEVSLLRSSGLLASDLFTCPYWNKKKNSSVSHRRIKNTIEKSFREKIPHR